jgi:hypothetical protein
MKTGIVPFNPHALDLDFGPSLIFEDGDESDLGGGDPGLSEGDSNLGEGLGEGDLLEVDPDQANDVEVEEEQLSQQLSQLSIGGESPGVRLMDLFTVPVLSPPRVREDQGQIISSMSSLTSDEYLNYLRRTLLEKKA